MRIVDAPLVAHLDGGVILDLPEEDVTTYVKSQVDLQWLPPDEDLVDFLERRIDDHLKLKRSRSDAPSVDPSHMSAMVLVEMPGFEAIEPTRKDILRKRFQEILDRPTRHSIPHGTHLD
jgi:hypothetical protein